MDMMPLENMPVLTQY